jgi:GNAT superfamily N-acetyltransferase
MTRTEGKTAPLRAPEPITGAHVVTGFSSGIASLDDWLKRRALKNESSRASRTYVVCAGAKRVVGYYALATGAVAHVHATSQAKRNMPDPIPVMVLGRLAVDEAYQGKGIGQGMLRDAILRTLQAADIAGIRALLVHAISDDARLFYERCGFQPSPVDPMTLMITIASAKQAIR